MPAPSPPPARPHKFVGPLTFNERSVLGAFCTFLGRTEEGESLANKPIEVSELANVLMLLESMAMSDGMFVDGTLPPKDLEILFSHQDRVTSETDVPIGIQRINPSQNELPVLFKDAAETASLSMQDFLSSTSGFGNETPLPGDIDKFVSDVRRGFEDPTGVVRQEIAQGIVESVSKGQKTYRGSKCVAAMLLANPDAGGLLPLAARQLIGVSDDVAARVASGLVNRFRVNYVNSLAGKKNAAYLADGSVEDLKGAQVVLFWRYVTQKLAELNKIKLPDGPPSFFDISLSAVPLGVAILLNTSGNWPADLLTEARALRSRSFCRAAAEESPQQRYLHEMTPDEFSEFQDFLFQDKWRKLADKSGRKEWSVSRWRQIRLPAVLASGLGAAIAAWPTIREMSHVLTLFLGTVGPAAGAAAGFVGEDLLHGRFKQEHIYVDHYRKIEKYLVLALKQNQAGQSLSDAVQRIFKRPLASSAKPA